MVSHPNLMPGLSRWFDTPPCAAGVVCSVMIPVHASLHLAVHPERMCVDPYQEFFRIRHSLSSLRVPYMVRNYMLTHTHILSSSPVPVPALGTLAVISDPSPISYHTTGIYH